MTQVTLEQALQIGLQHHEAGRLKEAEAIYRQILALHPNHSDALHLLGAVAAHEKKWDVAVELIGKAIALCPTNAIYHSNLGKILKDQGRAEEASRSCRRAIQLQPDLADAYNILAYTLLDSREGLDEGIAACQQAIRLKPQHAGAHHNLAVGLRKKGRLKEAEAACRQAISLQPGYVEAHHHLGHILRDQGQFNDALASYRRALELDPAQAEVYVSLSSVLQQLGRTAEAIAVCDLARSRGMDSPVLRYFLAGFTGATVPTTSPASYVVGLFEGYAATFEQHLVQKLQYHTPERLHEAVLRAAGMSGDASASRTLGDILDLGCGTGLCGRLFRPQARTLRGVDLSPDMIERARQHRVYDELMVADVTGLLSTLHNAYDLIISADVFIYVGDLDRVFAGVATALRPGGLFAFSVESHEPEGYVLRPTLRFAHSATYLRKLAGAYGFAEVSLEGSPIRLERGKEIPGWIVVLRKSK